MGSNESAFMYYLLHYYYPINYLIAGLYLSLAIFGILIGVYTKFRSGLKKKELFLAILFFLPAFAIILLAFENQFCGPFPIDKPPGSLFHIERIKCTLLLEKFGICTSLFVGLGLLGWFAWNWKRFNKCSRWLLSLKILMILNFFTFYSIWFALYGLIAIGGLS